MRDFNYPNRVLKIQVTQFSNYENEAIKNIQNQPVTISIKLRHWELTSTLFIISQFTPSFDPLNNHRNETYVH